MTRRAGPDEVVRAEESAPATRADLARRIAVARGEEKADLVLRGGRVVNVLTGEILAGDVAVSGAHIAGVGSYDGRRVIDVAGSFVAPGYIDAHIHLESTMLTPPEFARAVVPLGTTTVVADPHEIANVLGLEGIRFMIDASAGLPLRVCFMLPSCVPSSTLETAGARLTAADLADLVDHPRVLGLAEMMNYPGLLARDPEVLEKLEVFRTSRIDGHAPGLTGRDLNAYVAAGVGSDHECTSADEAREKLRAGMQVFIREGSVARNLAALLPVVTPANAPRCGLVSDDRHPTDLLAEGHVNHLLGRAVACGLDPTVALQLVTINPARHFGLGGLGAVAPGYRADLVVLDDLGSFTPRLVLQDGRVVARDGDLCIDLPAPTAAPPAAMNIGRAHIGQLAIPADGHTAMKVIGLVPEQIVTTTEILRPTLDDGCAVADPKRDLAKLAVIERHRGSGNVAVGFVRGLGLRHGAIAASVAHDAHNIVVAGMNDVDMWTAVEAVVGMGGGLVAASDGAVRQAVPLPVAGLMSERPFGEVATRVSGVLAVARALGSELHNPFMTLSFLALPVLPSLRLTDRGLVDVGAFRHVPLFGEA